MIKLLKYSAGLLVVIVLIRFIWLDINYNDSTITDNVKADFINAYDWVKGLNQPY